MEQEKNYIEWDGQYIGGSIPLFKAVTFAHHMLCEGRTRKEAIGIASSHYKLEASQVAIELMVRDYLMEDEIPESEAEEK